MSSNLFVMERIGADTEYLDIVAPAGVYNGNVVNITGRNANGTYQVSAPTAITNNSLLMVLHEDLGYNAEYVNMDDVTFATGAILRAAVLKVGNQVAIPVANVTATATVEADAFLIPDASALKIECVSSLGGTESLALVVEGTFVKAGVTLVRARVIKAQV